MQEPVLKEDFTLSELSITITDEKPDNGGDEPMEVELNEATPVSVNLCGAVAIAEVRSLLREWIQSSPGNSCWHHTHPLHGVSSYNLDYYTSTYI